MSGNKKRIVLSGASGFLGSHILEALIKEGYPVIALRRQETDLWRCIDVLDKVHWMNISETEKLSAFQPDILIHCAWLGVASGNRDDWQAQLGNINYTYALLHLSRTCGVEKIVALGSQAEYGRYEGRINEDFQINPHTAYGAVKCSVQHFVQSFCEVEKIPWVWLRLFSLFGPKEDKNWLLPYVITNLLDNKSVSLTGCTQRYDYLYVEDFVRGVLNVIDDDIHSGIYNFSSNTSMELRSLLCNVESMIRSKGELQLGKLPYRDGQVFHMEGNSERFCSDFHFQSSTDINAFLACTIDYYRNA